MQNTYEVEYQAIGTPNCAFEDGETTNDLGYDAILFRAPYDNENPAEVKTNEFYADVKDLEIKGSADNYIMSFFKMKVTIDEDGEIDKILYAKPLIKKKTVKNIKLETLPSNEKGSYYTYDYNGAKNLSNKALTDGEAIYFYTYDYNGEKYIGAKHLSGKALMDGEEVYFYNAPYSYIQPKYKVGTTSAQKYAARNEKNINFIEIELYEANKTDSGYKVTVQANPFSATNEDEFFTDDSTALINALTQVYTGGLYSADIYDVDGDGIYDYMDYRPYKFAVVDTTVEKSFYKDGIRNGDADEAPIIYTNKAVTTGTSFADGDFVIGYFNKSANFIEIAAVVKPVVGAVKDISDANKTIVLSNGEKVSTSDAWKLVSNYDNLDAFRSKGYDVSKTEFKNTLFEKLTNPSVYGAKDAEYYVYNGVLLFFTGVDNSETDGGQNPVMNFIGPYASGRARALVEADGMKDAKITIEWSNSAFDLRKWEIKGEFDAETLSVTYDNALVTDISYGEDGETETKEVVSETDKGSIVFSDETLSFIWNDELIYTENMEFTWSFAPEE